MTMEIFFRFQITRENILYVFFFFLEETTRNGRKTSLPIQEYS